MSIPEGCCTKHPVVSNYKPVGTTTTIGDMDVYQVGDTNSKVTLFAVYDIFGFHNNTYQVCDLLSKQGYHVILPDFFRGKSWSLSNFPPKDFSEFKDWAFVKHSWSKISEDINNILKNLKGDLKCEKMGIFGFCWGGKMVFDSLKIKEPLFHSGAAVHPAMISDEDIKSVAHPILAIISSGEAELLSKNNLLQSSVADNSKWLDFTDQEHGFCAARGNFEDPQNKQRATEAIHELAFFFKKTLG